MENLIRFITCFILLDLGILAVPTTIIATVQASTMSPPPFLELEKQEISIQPVPPPISPPRPEESYNVNYNISGPSGMIATENFPESYKSNTNTTWSITVRKGHRIVLTFHLLSLERNAECIWDSVSIFDTNKTLLRKLCGNLRQDLKIISNGNAMMLHFISDRVLESAGFLASWKEVAEDAISNTKNGEGIHLNKGYSLTFPQSFAVSAESPPETLCLELYNVTESGTIEIKLYVAEKLLSKNASETKIIHYVGGNNNLNCFPFYISKDIKGNLAVLSIEGTFTNSNYTILSFKSVKLIRSRNIVMFQTDKPDYRPNQDVKFRIFLLNQELKPSSIKVVPEVWISNPRKARIMQWKNVTLNHGLSQLSMNLGPEPVIGTWQIYMQLNDDHKDVISFTVSETIPPKFEVIITSPHVILRNSNQTQWKVCAKYTHGSGVVGTINATFHTSFDTGHYWNSLKINRVIIKLARSMDDGCANFVLNQTELSYLVEHSTKILLIATMEESNTETYINASKRDVVQATPFKIEFPGSLKSHIVSNSSLPYQTVIMVATHDSKVLPNVKLEICIRYFSSIQNVRDYASSLSRKFYTYNEDQFLALANILNSMQVMKTCVMHESTEDGTIRIAIPINSAPKNVSKLSILAKAVEHKTDLLMKMFQPVGKLDVSLTHNGYSSSMSIGQSETNMIKCGKNSITVFISAPPNSSFDIVYYLTSGGVIHFKGKKIIMLGNEDKSESYIAGTHIINMMPHFSDEHTNDSSSIMESHKLEFSRPFNTENQVTGKFNLLIVSRSESGETVSVTNSYKVESCDPKPVITWSKQSVNPNNNVTITLKGEKNSFCALTVVDKSVDLVSNDNKITAEKILDLKEDIASARILTDENKEECNNANLMFNAFIRLGLYVMSDRLEQHTSCDTIVDAILKQKKDLISPSIQYESEDHVSFSIEQEPQLMSSANAEIAAAPYVLQTDSSSFSTEEASSDKLGDHVSKNSAIEIKPSLLLRNYFPETWLFDLIVLDNDGNAHLNKTAPHTITEWIGSIVCSDDVSGIGISDVSSLLVNQAFHVDIYMPFSLKRGEVVPLNASAFNNINSVLPLMLSIKETSAIKSITQSKNVCLGINKSKIERFDVVAKELGSQNVTVTAVITSKCEANKMDPDIVGYVDTIQKQILIKPEGIPVENVQSRFYCHETKSIVNKLELEPLVLPSNTVKGSERAYLTLTGDIMAPSLVNMDKLISLPAGCGEQNMIGLLPNIYLLEYLKATRKGSSEIKNKAKNNIIVGYERQQKFRHKDGSFSIWGPQDKVGSMWLTSFVVKSFVKAYNYINGINLKELEQSLEWIAAHQNTSNGCFDNIGYVYHRDLQGASKSLSAFVLITLLEYKQSLRLPVDEKVIHDTVKCIHETSLDLNDTYTLSVATYSLTLYYKIYPREAKKSQTSEQLQPIKLMTQLIENSNKTILDGQNSHMLAWTTDNVGKSEAVEVTAYNIISLTMQNNMVDALRATRWLATQRNSRGGFVSTQDTVVALQALSLYASKATEGELDLEVNILRDFQHIWNLSMNHENQLLLHSMELSKDFPYAIEMKTKGQGCVFIQSILRYNIHNTSRSNSATPFIFSIKLNQANSLKVCIKYVGSRIQTNMLVLEIEMLTGFKADQEYLKTILNEVDSSVKRFEIDNEMNKVILYLDEMIQRQKLCLDLNIKQIVTVKKLQDATANIYDYYHEEDKASMLYNAS